MKKVLLSIVLFVVALVPAMADSPLTSTEWWDSYADTEIMKEAREKGCTDEVLRHLTSSDVELDLRLALVNGLGWNIDGQHNAELFLEYYGNHYGKSKPEEMSGETLIVYAYLKAMDDYFDVKEAYRLATLAHQKNTRSKGVAMIYGLIRAQNAMGKGFSRVYKVVATYVDRQNLKQDISDYAVKKIMEYIDEYKEYSR